MNKFGELVKSFFTDIKVITGNEGGWMWMIPVATAALGAMQGKKKREEAQRMNNAAAEQTRFSPWTGMGAGTTRSEGSGMLGGAVQGGLAGLGMYQGMGGGKAAANAAGGINAGNADQIVNQQAASGQLMSGGAGGNAQSANPFAGDDPYGYKKLSNSLYS